MRFLRSYMISSPIFFLLAGIARADSITTFSLSGAYAPLRTGTLPGSPVSGTITIDTTTGVIDTVNLNDPESNQPYEDTYIDYASPGFPIVEVEEAWGKLEPEFINLYIPVSTLVGYKGGSVCSLDTPCSQGPISSTGNIQDNDFIYGDLSPAATPEPSSLILLGIGAFAMLGLARGKGSRELRHW